MTSASLPPAAASRSRRVLLLGPVAGSSAPVANVATSQAFAIRIVVPGQAAVTAGLRLGAERLGRRRSAGFAYPDDGSVLTSGAITLGATAERRRRRSATPSAEVNGISLFGGEVTVAARRREGAPRPRRLGRRASATSPAPASAASAARPSPAAPLGDWGTSRVGSGVGSPSTSANGAHGLARQRRRARHPADRRPRRPTRGDARS